MLMFYFFLKYILKYTFCDKILFLISILTSHLTFLTD